MGRRRRIGPRKIIKTIPRTRFFFQDNPTDTNPVKDIDIDEGFVQLKRFSLSDFISDLSHPLVNFDIEGGKRNSVSITGRFIIRH
ncbi:hypothetical protein ED352_15045, partial [Muribaculaceae bacterium Isolate-002 (NCI)]